MRAEPWLEEIRHGIRRFHSDVINAQQLAANAMSLVGLSRHFPALLNLVAIGA
jgi:hypothetical protein